MTRWIDTDWDNRRMERRPPRPVPQSLDEDPPLHRWLVRNGRRRRVTCEFRGQFANQLFQIAATISHARRIGGFAFIPDWAYTRVFRAKFATGYSTGGMSVYKEPNLAYSTIPPRGDLILTGYFQSYRHIDEPLVRRAFEFNPRLVRDLQDRYADLRDLRTASVHVRRGDTLSPTNHMAVLPDDYYERAMILLPEVDRFVVFSDDIPWCRERFRGPKFRFITGEENFADLCLMSMCHHHIIANSTFSWWGAWLNRRRDKRVIAPQRWFKPEFPEERAFRFPPDWIRI